MFKFLKRVKQTPMLLPDAAGKIKNVLFNQRTFAIQQRSVFICEKNNHYKCLEKYQTVSILELFNCCATWHTHIKKIYFFSTTVNVIFANSFLHTSNWEKNLMSIYKMQEKSLTLYMYCNTNDTISIKVCSW